MEKRVRFQEKLTVHLMCTWTYAYKNARQGEWEQAARDRERFKFIIERIGKIILPVLMKKLEMCIRDNKSI